MPSETVESRIGKIQSKINPELLRGKTDFERMVLEQNDKTLQHGEVLARSADEQNKYLDTIQTQVLETNGKVKNHESRIKENETFIRSIKTSAKKRTAWTIALIPIIGVGLEIIAKKAGWL
jgi:hypothetical protein